MGRPVRPLNHAVWGHFGWKWIRNHEEARVPRHLGVAAVDVRAPVAADHESGLADKDEARSSGACRRGGVPAGERRLGLTMELSHLRARGGCPGGAPGDTDDEANDGEKS